MQTQLQQVKVQLSKDLCDSNIANRIYYGAKVDVVGVLKEQKAENKNGTSTQLDIFLEASYIKIYDDFFNLQITKEEEEKIIKIGKSENPLKIISENIFYGIHGYEKEGEAITLAGAEGITDMPKGKRGKIHIMLMGDSGTAKSAMLKSAFRCFPKARYCSGKTVTGVGLVGAVVRDGKMGDASFEAGALALSDNGSIMLDELDKINEEDRDALHEPLDMMTITIDKYNFHLQLLARTNVLAGANPKGSKFDPNQTIYSQIDLPDTIINRFDLIFIHRREKNVEREEHIARKILTRNEFVPELDRDFIKKYFIYIKRFNPKLTPFLQKEYIPKKYAGIRGATEEQEYPTTPRHVEIIERLSEAKARIHLRDEVSKEDVDFAIDLLYHSLKQFGIDPVTGKVDEMLIETGVSSTQAGRINTIRQIINEITNREGKLIPIENIIAEAKPKNINEDSVEEVIEKLKKAGDIFEPRRGYISKI
jgi:replicative DNA helicase Mcm